MEPSSQRLNSILEEVPFSQESLFHFNQKGLARLIQARLNIEEDSRDKEKEKNKKSEGEGCKVASIGSSFGGKHDEDDDDATLSMKKNNKSSKDPRKMESSTVTKNQNIFGVFIDEQGLIFDNLSESNLLKVRKSFKIEVGLREIERLERLKKSIKPNMPISTISEFKRKENELEISFDHCGRPFPIDDIIRDNDENLEKLTKLLIIMIKELGESNYVIKSFENVDFTWRSNPETETESLILSTFTYMNIEEDPPSQDKSEPWKKSLRILREWFLGKIKGKKIEVRESIENILYNADLISSYSKIGKLIPTSEASKKMFLTGLTKIN